MPHYDTSLSSKGRLTLPAGVRQTLQLETGDAITWIDKGQYPALESGSFRQRIILRENAEAGWPATLGILRDWARDMPIPTIEEMDEIVDRSRAEDYERKLREAEQGYDWCDDTPEPDLLPDLPTRITVKGQITMPESYRHKYAMQEGDAVVLNDQVDHLSVVKARDILARVAGSLSAYAGNGPIEIDRDRIWAGIARKRDQRIHEQVAERSSKNDDAD